MKNQLSTKIKNFLPILFVIFWLNEHSYEVGNFNSIVRMPYLCANFIFFKSPPPSGYLPPPPTPIQVMCKNSVSSQQLHSFLLPDWLSEGKASPL